MQHLTCRFLLLVLLVATRPLTAQTTAGRDVLHKLDRATLTGRVDEIGDTYVTYFEVTAPTAPKTIAKSLLWKIVFADGTTEVLNALPATPASVAEVRRPDLLMLRGGDRVIEAHVEAVEDGTIRYRRFGETGGKTYTLATGKVQRIRYGDGREETFEGVADRQSLEPTADGKPARPARGPRVTRSPNEFARVNLTLGVEGAYFPKALNADWVSDSAGMGMGQNLGFSLRFDYRLHRRLALSLTGGYYGWQLTRRYTLYGNELYAETQNLIRIPLQAGVKLYLLGGLYVMPEGGVNLLMSTLSPSDTHPAPISTSTRLTPLAYGASLGGEVRFGGVLLDLSARYHLLDVQNLTLNSEGRTFSDRVQVVSVRVGIGFSAGKNK
jgi:hypothetical protein